MPKAYAKRMGSDRGREVFNSELSDGLGEDVEVSLTSLEDGSNTGCEPLISGNFPKLKLLAPARISSVIEQINKTDTVIRTQIVITPTECWSTGVLFDMVVLLKYLVGTCRGTYHFYILAET
jgi:hypothetical protein